MTAPYTLFEVSWEVCNKVGGIHTVVSTKAKTLVERLGDDYITLGPWLLSGGQHADTFEEDPSFAAFSESCRAAGLPVRVGRWRIPGRPRTILVGFSGQFDKKDEVLSKLWEDFHVDSITGQWDYIEPVLFGWAAARVIEKWWRERVAPERRPAVAQFHEWMTGSGGLYLKKHAPSIGSVFTTHATILGRSISSGGKTPEQGLGGRKTDAVAREHHVAAKCSMEGVCARELDVFTTVSRITADEARLLYGRTAEPLLPNGIDLDVIDELAGDTTRERARQRLANLARRFLGTDVENARFVCVSGRYEFHNKGIDLTLDALARLNAQPGRKIVLFVLVPAGNSGPRGDVLERLALPVESATGPIGISTHNLFEPERDPVQSRCAALGLDNRVDARVAVVQIPIYLDTHDGILDLPYEAVLRAMDLSCFPSFYEPWGYTPEESLAVGVPTVTTDMAGFGRWARELALGPSKGVFLLEREGVEYAAAVARLASMLHEFIEADHDQVALAAVCRATARLASWSDLIAHYEAAFASAIAIADVRAPLTSIELRPKLPLTVLPTPEGARPRLVRFGVSATLPASLAGLARLARNFWWSWDAEATALFRELNSKRPERWDEYEHNPVTFLRDMYPADLAERAADAGFCARLARVLERFDAYMKLDPEPLPLAGGGSVSSAHPVAYFCAEFGVHESLKVYSGGLGILSGDHLKSASDLNLPLVAFGLFYKNGYTKQKLTAAGEQISGEAHNEPRDLPLELVLDERDQPLEIELEFPSSRVLLRAWRVQVGRVSLYLLDADVPANRPEDRDITRRLYGGDHEMRLRQEIVLGRGGKRLLTRMGITPACFHINEGHAAFLVLERVARLVREFGLTFDEAREFVRSTTIFTTHTPVPAGHDRFGEDLMRRYFADAPSWVGVPWEAFFALGTADDDRGSFNMTYLAMNFASFVNGVSELHGQVSQELLRPFWPRLLQSEVPVTSVTNGVHLPTWTHPDVARLLGVVDRPVTGDDFARGARAIPDQALWDHRVRSKERMLNHVRERLHRSFIARGDSPIVLSRMLDGFNPRALWIGFARRFAPYKRAQLLLRDPARLARILNTADRPLRILFAGKAHPNDRHGQDILRQVAEAARREEFLGKLFFVEDYDLDLARHLVTGVDVWLNNPTRPLEASGTSGMKVAANGGLNLSVLDGWWIEAYDEKKKNGWAVGAGQVYPTQELQDELDCESLYRLLEEELLPSYFENKDAPSLSWLEIVKHNLETIPVRFNTDRMVSEYRDRAYLPLARNWFQMHADRFAGTRSKSRRVQEVRRGFGNVRILAAHMADLSGLNVGDEVEVRMEVDLDGVAREDVAVELVLGPSLEGRDLRKRAVQELLPAGRNGSATIFQGRHRVTHSGPFAYGLRVRARTANDLDLALRDLQLWA